MLCYFYYYYHHRLKEFFLYALAGVAQWFECWSADQRVTSSISGQGTCLGCRPGPLLGTYQRQPIDVSLAHQCFPPSLPPSLPHL